MNNKRDNRSLYEELDATASIGPKPQIEPESALDDTAPLEHGSNSPTNAGDDIYDTLEDTQNVSVWLNDSWLSSQETKNSNVTNTAQTPPTPRSVGETKNEERNQFNDFEMDAPEPPKPHRFTSSTGKKAPAKNSGLSHHWVQSLQRHVSTPAIAQRKFQLVGISLLAFLCVGGLTAYNLTPSKEWPTGGELPQTAALTDIKAVADKPLVTVYSSAEQRYCLTQGIKLGAAVKHAASPAGKAAFNLHLNFADFAERCENFQYVPQEFLKAALVSESVMNKELLPIPAIDHVPKALGLVTESKPAKPNNTDTTPALLDNNAALQEPSQLVKNIQWRLFKLGFYKERSDKKARIDGVYNEHTQAAVHAFFDRNPELERTTDKAVIFSALDSVYTSRKR